MTKKNGPRVVILAGPNGAGKSTSAEILLRGALGVDEFVNADVIAQGLSGFAPQSTAFAAGRVMLARLKHLASQHKSFGFETTLAGRWIAPWIAKLSASGYEIHLVFLWLPSEEAAVARVAERVRLGGHDIPEPVIRRRFRAGLRNFFDLYQPLADTWQVVDNSNSGQTNVIAAGKRRDSEAVVNHDTWTTIQRTAELRR